MKPKQTRLQQLGKRGIYAFYVDDVLSRLTKGQTTDALQKAAGIPIIAAGGSLMVGLKKRVMQRGELGDGNVFPGYKKKERVVLSAPYRDAAGVRYDTYLNEDVFHKRLKSKVGSYVVTGGMWRGTEVRTTGKMLVFEFIGKSMGRGKKQSAKVEYVTKGGKKSKRYKYTAEAEVADNRYKGGRIWIYHKVNVLAHKRRELVQMGKWIGLTAQQRQLAALLGVPYIPDKFTTAQNAALASLAGN